MQTFLPYPNFHQSAKCLDRQRLYRQRIEARQIIDILDGNAKSTAWQNHPAVLMWTGCSSALKEYFNTISQEWINRGYQHNMRFYPSQIVLKCPVWFGNMEFHVSHQSNLVRKLPEHYKRYFPDVPDNLPYVWPRGDWSNAT